MADTAIADPVTPVDPKNDGTPTVAPAVDNSGEVEQAKLEADKERMRANQLANELQTMRDSQAAVDKKQLEDKEEYKALYEKNDAELKQIREDRERSERQTQLATETETVFKDYPAEVIKVAKTAGISLTDDSEAARTSLKEKLDSLKETVSPSANVTPNNPYTPDATAPERAKVMDEIRLKGASGDATPANQFISNLESVKAMKRQAGVQVD